jgi:hypothetical protein
MSNHRVLAVLAAGACLWSVGFAPAPLPKPDPREAATGIWKVPESQIEAERERVKGLNARAKAAGKAVVYGLGFPNSFRYHGDTVTMHLIAVRDWHGRSPDDYYRVKIKWKGNDLFWLPPHGTWTRLATLANGKFQKENPKYQIESAERPPWVFEKVKPEKLNEYEKPLASEREPYDYELQVQPAPRPPAGRRK